MHRTRAAARARNVRLSRGVDSRQVHARFAQHEAHAAAFKLPAEMWSYIWGFMSADEIEDLRERGAFTHGNFKANDAIWKYLYLNTFAEVTPGSKLSVELSADRSRLPSGVDAAHADASLVQARLRDTTDDPQLAAIYRKHGAHASGAVEPRTRQRRRRGGDGGDNNMAATSLWYDLFAHDWDRFMHVYVDKYTGDVVHYDYPRVPTAPLVRLWLNFEYEAAAAPAPVAAAKQRIKFHVRLEHSDSMSVDEYAVYESLFANTGVVVRFQYKPSRSEIAATVGRAARPTKLVTRFVLDASGNRVRGVNIDSLLGAANARRRPPLLDIDVTKHPPTMALSNTLFLNAEPLRTPFAAGVFVTKAYKPRGQRTLLFEPRDDGGGGSGDSFSVTNYSCDAVCNKLSNDTDAQQNSPQARALRSLLVAKTSRLG